MFIGRLLVMLVGLASLAQPLGAQFAERPGPPPRERTEPLLPVSSLQVRPPLHTELVLMQTAAGLGGGILGSMVMIFPFALAEMGGKRDVPDGVPIVAAVLGYFGGSALGVQLYSRSAGMRGSWWWTLGGATAGAIGGPAFPVTVPIGAVIGYNRTREYRPEAQVMP